MKKLWEKQEKQDKESGIFLLLLFIMACYYGWRLFVLTPWYDELYTYYYFISRGPVYAAIHWPLPNNHVGFSVLSAILMVFGNSAIALRGISWISSLISLCLLFVIGRKCFPKGFALIPPCLYASMEIVNMLAVQGRGYALASCLYLLAFYELLQIIVYHKNTVRNHILLACALIWALYTLPSSVYFVVPLSLTGLSWLFREKRLRECLKLFITLAVSAVCTVGLYAVIWLAIGSNLLSKIPDGPFYMSGHVAIILHAPFKSLKTGVEYMLDTPYIQSVPREGYLSRFAEWIKTLFGYYYSGMALILLIAIGIGFIALAVVLYKIISGKKKEGFLEWYLFCSILLTPFMLLVQAALPYYRVFSFFGIPVVLLLTWMLTYIVKCIKKPVAAYGITAIVILFSIVKLTSSSYMAQYSDREAAVKDAYAHMEMETGTKVCVTDCDQEYLMKYLYNQDSQKDVTYVPQEADYVLLDKLLLLSGQEIEVLNSADAWKFYVTHEEIPWDYLEENMALCYENDRFLLYERKE